MPQVNWSLLLLGVALGCASPSPAASTVSHGDRVGVVNLIAVGVASVQPLRFQVVDVGKKVVVACGHAGVEELIWDFLQISVLHLLWLSAKNFI